MLKKNIDSIDSTAYRTSAEVDRISDLLEEYSEKLRTLLRERERQERRRLTMFSVSAALVFCVFFYLKEPKAITPEILGFVLIPATPIIFVAWVNSLISGVSLRKTIRISSDRLFRVLRIVSQLEEHGEPTVSGRIELSIRLSEAEALLHDAEKKVSFF